MKKNNRHPNWILHLAGILFCLTLFSMHLTSGLYARYTSSASGSDSARVARFDVTADELSFSETIPAEIAPGESNKQTINVKNNSETAIRYTISVENITDNLPLTFSVGGDANSQTLELDAGKTADCAVTVSWPDTSDALKYMGMVDLITVTMTAEQID